MTKIIEKSYELIERVFDYVERDYTLDDYKHINNNKSLIVNTLYDLKYNIDLMINDYNEAKGNILIGRLLPMTAKRIKEDIGIDLDKYSLVYNKSDVRHIYLGHIQNSRRQVPLMINDILLFPFVMADYDSITKDNEGKLILEKWISHNYRVVVIITRKRKNITLKSMYITKKGKNKSLPISHDS